MTDDELKAYIAEQQAAAPGARRAPYREQSQSVLAPSYVPQQEESILPALGGMAGGLAGGLLIKNPMAGATAGRAFVGSMLPSLAGSSAGTVVGTGVERGIKGDLLSTEGGKQMVGNLLENAAWDVGGNLVVGFLGKTYKLRKEILEKAGIKQSGEMASEQEARNAAQAFLSKNGATLTFGQLTGEKGFQALEGVLKGGTGSGVYAKQEAGVQKAVSQGLQDVRNSLDTSQAFKDALLTEAPLTRTAGENFQTVITTARDAFKDAHRPFYQKLSQENGVFLDMRNIKKQAQDELLRIEKAKGVGSSADRADVLSQVLKQDDFVDFGVAHDIRSSLYGAANDLAAPGANATTKQQAYTAYAKMIDKEMDNAVQLATGSKGDVSATFRTPLSKELVQQYRTTSAAYSEGMSGLYNETINAAMKQSPSKVGKLLADLTESEKFIDLNKAVAQIDKYVKEGGKQSVAAIGDIKYNFLENALSTPEKALQFNQKLKDNPDLKRSFYQMFRSEAPQLKTILSAADIGLEAPGPMSQYLRSRTAGTLYQGTAAVVGYMALPDNVTDKLKDSAGNAVLTGGVLLITPRMLAKAATNKNAMDALAGLTKFTTAPRVTGAVAAKLADQLNKSGIIDSEYMTAVDNVFNQPKQGEPSQDNTPVSTDDIDAYIKSMQGR